jgi:methionine synthase I (cobalamin-dependent)
MTEAEMTDVFGEQIGALIEGGVDGIIIETMMDPTEAACAIRAAKAVAPNVPVLATLTFDRNPRGFRTMMGATPTDGIRRLLEAGADAVGANCGGMTPGDFVPLLEEVHRAVAAPLIVEANAGLPQIEDGKAVFKEVPETFGRLVAEWIRVGATIIGGCCGTTPDHIRAVSEAVKRR